ncbi:hypothetical protein [Lysobacter sp. A3-1-A15]|uniref:hypothetical protein n=1 Tax=Novilysobacter viscosus TaxID=3098602 RepID=UPI002ED9F69B
MNPWMLAAAVAALLLLAAIRVGEGRHRRILVPSVVLGGLAMVLALGWGARASGYYPSSRALRLAKQVSIELAEAARDPAVQRVIIIEGSSYTARGLDGSMLARLLTRGSGTKTAVVQMSLDGANHFERSWLLDIALDQLTRPERQALEAKEVTLLLEIQRGYDYSPLNGFVRNLRTWRTYAYMTPGNSLDGLRSVWSLGGKAPESAASLLSPAAEHAAVNAMGIGLARRGARFDDTKPVHGYQPLKRSKRGYSHGDGMSQVLEAAQAMDDSVAPPMEAVPWVKDLRVPRYRALLGNLLDSTAFFAVPSTEVADIEYVRAFCAGATDRPCIEYRDPALLKRLQRKPDWNDARHMRVSGAEKFTRWFAQRYMRDVIAEKNG